MPELLGMLAAVALILALAYACTRMIGKYGGMPGGACGGEICVLRQIPVGRGERIALVRVHQKCILLGVAQGGVSVLCELSEEDSARWLEAARPAGGADFRSVLRRSMEKKK